TRTSTCPAAGWGRATSSSTRSDGARRTIAFMMMMVMTSHRDTEAQRKSSPSVPVLQKAGSSFCGLEDVDGIERRLSREHVRHFLRRLRLQLHQRLLGVEAGVRREDDVALADERRVHGRLVR